MTGYQSKKLATQDKLESKHMTEYGRFPQGSDSKRKALNLMMPWAPRKKLPGEAPPLSISIWQQPVYKSPVMDTPRAGAHDHKNIKSKI
jgi:hypothetical protein